MSRPEGNVTPTNRASPSPGVSVQGVVVFVGFITFFVALIIFICCCTLRLSRRHEQVNGASEPNTGLDSEVLRGLPVFVYSSCKGGKKLECAVCLEEFEEGEKGRVLPSCDHRFHVECIDMWLHSHSSCPLCRTAVKAETSGSNIV